MTLENDLEMFGRRLNNLENPQSYIRVGRLEELEEGTTQEGGAFSVETSKVELNIPLGEVSPEQHSHRVTFRLERFQPPNNGALLKGNVKWVEEDIHKTGVAILAAPHAYIYSDEGEHIPEPLRPGSQLLLLFVSGLTFGIPFVGVPVIDLSPIPGGAD